MTDELQPLGGKKIIQRIGYVCIVLGVIVIFFEHVDLSLPTFDTGQAVSAANAHNNNGGLSSGAVSDLQARLAQDKTIYPEGIVSGIYGNLTSKAVMRFQKKYQLAATGAADAVTLQKIHDVFALPVGAPVKTSAASSVKNTAAAAAPAVQPKPAPPQKPGAITAVVKDQFGLPSQVSYWIEGERGVEALRCCSQTNAQTGRLETAAFEPGQYVLHIKPQSYQDFYDSIARSINVPLGGLWLDTIVIKKWPKVAAHLTFPSGTNYSGAYLVNAKGEQSIRFSSPNAGGRVESNSPVPFGSYTFHAGTWEGAVAERNIQVTESDKEVWLGDVVLAK